MCLKKKPKSHDPGGCFQCKSCGAVTSKKKKICKPKRIAKA